MKKEWMISDGCHRYISLRYIYEPRKLSGTQADSGSRPPECFYAGNRIISFFLYDLFRHVRCESAFPRGGYPAHQCPGVLVGVETSTAIVDGRGDYNKGKGRL